MNQKILIVGDGPVGLTRAIELACYGIPLRIVDKAAQRADGLRSDPARRLPDQRASGREPLNGAPRGGDPPPGARDLTRGAQAKYA
jgi:2-polyprenyl-6-methoxyphenol hydroxylase-like FAD-dependent oxidoreductase